VLVSACEFGLITCGNWIEPWNWGWISLRYN